MRSGMLVLTACLLAATTHAPSVAAPATVLVLPGDAIFPESITAAPSGDLFVSSLVTGEIARFPAGSTVARAFVPDAVNVGTAGVMVAWTP